MRQAIPSGLGTEGVSFPLKPPIAVGGERERKAKTPWKVDGRRPRAPPALVGGVRLNVFLSFTFEFRSR